MLNRYFSKITFYGFVDIHGIHYRYNDISALKMEPKDRFIDIDACFVPTISVHEISLNLDIMLKGLTVLSTYIDLNAHQLW